MPPSGSPPRAPAKAPDSVWRGSPRPGRVRDVTPLRVLVELEESADPAADDELRAIVEPRVEPKGVGDDSEDLGALRIERDQRNHHRDLQDASRGLPRGPFDLARHRDLASNPEPPRDDVFELP